MHVGTWALPSKLLMILVVSTTLLKQFFYMKIFAPFAYIVKMIFSVIDYLKVFMFFFVILIVSFAQVFDVISPNDLEEYRFIGRYMGNIITTMRLALGDFSFEVLEDRGPGM